ncbi:MAG: hypothetical protein QW531_03155, partial [Thermoplasmata archaeon]
GENVEIKIGNRLPLKNINPGTEIFEIEIVPSSGGKLIRSAGSFGVMMGIEGDYALIKMPSGEIRKIHKECYATIGRVSNSAHRLQRLGKAGRNIAAVGIGVNKNAKLIGHPLEDNKVYGTVHIGFGDNSRYGGKIKCGYHAHGVILKPTIFADGEVVVENGVIKLERKK